MAKQNLEEVMLNVDNLDTDNPEDMETLVQAITGGAVDPLPESEAPKADAPKPDAPKAADPPAAPNPAEPAPTSAAAPAAAPAAPAIQEADGVLAKDGKNVLPWSVLEGTRKQKAEAEARATEAETALEATRAELEKMKAGQPAEAPKTVDQIKQQIADLKAKSAAAAEEAPWLAETQNQTIATLEAMLAMLPTQQAPAPAPAQPAAPSDDPVRAAIDATPALAHFEANNQEMFEYATAIDQRLRTQPAWQGKPLTERFAKVVEIVRATHGDEVLPPELRQAPAAPVIPPADKPLPKTDAPAISSLTDIPGGTPTAPNALQAMETASPTAIANSLAKLENPDDIIRFITQ